MPELPEVETIRKSLLPTIGRTIEAVTLSAVAPLRFGDHTKVIEKMRGARIINWKRRGKFLLLQSDDATLVLHMGMSGRLLYEASDLPTKLHTHLELKLNGSTSLRFVDPRRFGMIGISTDPEARDMPSIARLGFEYDDPNLTEVSFIAKCRRRPKSIIKNLLLDQAVVTGIGNIYACEALYLARIDPRRRVHDLSEAELGRLLASIRSTLNSGIKNGGTTLRDYVDSSGNKGDNQNHLLVYDREGLNSGDDNGPVEKIVQQGRSTWWCPRVQQ